MKMKIMNAKIVRAGARSRTAPDAKKWPPHPPSPPIYRKSLVFPRRQICSGRFLLRNCRIRLFVGLRSAAQLAAAVRCALPATLSLSFPPRGLLLLLTVDDDLTARLSHSHWLLWRARARARLMPNDWPFFICAKLKEIPERTTDRRGAMS